MKLAVVGIDGGSFELMDKWLDQLPNLAKVKEKGCWADMQSVLPPVTSPNWKVYSTGMNPGKIGIYYWENIIWEQNKVYYPTERKTQHKEIWDYLNGHGKKCVIIGVPLTFPPKKITYTFISGPPDAMDKGFVYPKDLEPIILNWGHRPGFTHSIVTNREKATEEIVKKIWTTLETTKHQVTKMNPDFLHVTSFYINELQHYLWDDEATLTGWRHIDDFVGWIQKQGYNLLIMSDHGSNEIKQTFNINTWLEYLGYLKLQGSLVNLRKLGITQERLAGIIKSPAIISFLKKVVPDKVFKTVPLEEGATTFNPKENAVDWVKSRVLASDQGPLYLRDRDDENLKRDLISELEMMPDIVRGVYRGTDLYWGEFIDEAPDLVIDYQDGIHINSGLGLKNVFSPPAEGRWKAENKRTGMFMGIGEDILRTGYIDSMSILDLAPTILNLMDVPTPEIMDGKDILG